MERREEPRAGRDLESGQGEKLLARVAREVGPTQFERYFDGQARLEVREDRVEVTVPSGFLAEMLSRRFGEQIRRAATEEGGRRETTPPRPLEVRFRVDRSAFDRAIPRPVGSVQPAPSRPLPRPAPGPSPASTGGRTAATVRHRFENFIVGESNKLAYGAAVRLAEESGPQPVLFVHGVSGVGKTHLLHSIGARFVEKRPGANVKLISAEAFTNEFITAVRTGKVDAFRRAFRRLDLLCLDDVHFLSNKDATQNELLFTFDTIGLDGARVAMASDEHPREIRKLSDRLVSRFMAGAVVRIDLPDLPLRETLARTFAARRGLKLEEGALRLIVERSAQALGSMGGCGGSVREIEGLLNQVEAMHRIVPELATEDGHIGAVLVRKALGLDRGGPGHAPAGGAMAVHGGRIRRPITVEAVVAEVCRSLCVDLADFMSKGRHKRVVLARSLVSSLSRRLTTMSFPEIARAMGRTNHSTVITAQKRIDKEMAREDGGRLEPGLIPGYAGTSVRVLADELAELITRHSHGG